VADVLRKSVADAPDDPVARRAALVRRGRHAEASKEAVEQIIALRAAGLSYAAIAERLNHDGVATAQHAMRWQAGSVHRVLRRAAARRGDWPRLEQALNVGRGRREHPPRYERPWANPPEVREFILDRAREGLPLAKIVRELTRLDVPTARGGQWRISTVAAIVNRAERSNSQAARHAATSLAQAQE
jgi:hypothetical protein